MAKVDFQHPSASLLQSLSVTQFKKKIIVMWRFAAQETFHFIVTCSWHWFVFVFGLVGLCALHTFTIIDFQCHSFDHIMSLFVPLRSPFSHFSHVCLYPCGSVASCQLLSLIIFIKLLGLFSDVHFHLPLFGCLFLNFVQILFSVVYLINVLHLDYHPCLKVKLLSMFNKVLHCWLWVIRFIMTFYQYGFLA